jgi:ABC-type Fe3+ transport system substrate-binding protein
MLPSLNRNRSLLFFLAGLVLCAAIGGAHFLGGGASGTAATLTLLTPHGDNIRQEIGSAFQSWYRNHYGPSPELVWVDQGGVSNYVQIHFAKTPASIGIDLLFGGGTSPFRALARDGLLQPRTMPRAALEKIPHEVEGIKILSDSEGWYGVALSSFGILYNRSLLAAKGFPEPKAWADLGRPGLQGWVACVDPRGSGSAHVIYEIILQKHGWEKGWEILARMGANSGHFTRGASGVLPLISTGEAAYTVAIDLYAWSLMEEVGKEKLGFILPADETAITVDPAGVLKGAPRPLEASRFLEFLVSEDCQRLLALQAGVPGGPARLSLNRMPVLPSVYSMIDTGTSLIRGNPFSESPRGWTYSDSLTESRWNLVSDALGLWVVDNHEAAARVWSALSRRYPREGDSAKTAAWESEVRADKYFRPPAPWAEMEKLAAHWKEEAFRNQTMARWAKELHD